MNIKSFKEACKILNIDSSVLPDVSGLSEKYQKAQIAFYKLSVIADAANGDWKPDFNSTDQWKYFPWFVWDTRKKDFVLDYVGGCYTSTGAASRLCFKSEEIAEYIATTFESLYNDYLSQ